MSIKENTIVSTTDTKVTLLQWLKTLDKNVTELKENGVKPSFKVITTDEFVKSHENEPTGIDFVVIDNYGEYWFIFGNYAIEFEDDTNGVIRVNGFLGNVYNLPDEPHASAYSAGLVHLMKNDNVWEIYDNDPWGNNPDVVLASLSNIKQITNSTNYKALTTKLTSRDDLLPLVAGYGKNAYGIANTDTNGKNLFMGKLNGNTGAYRSLQGIYVKGDNEIYYTTGNSSLNINTGEIQNAVSGTEFKEAVRLANQKTYWHTINLHNSGTLSDVHITIVIPSHSSTQVANVQDLLAIGAGDTWGCSGTIATTESALPIVTFDGVKFGATADATIFSGTLGRTYTLTQLIAKSLEYYDNVKEVK